MTLFVLLLIATLGFVAYAKFRDKLERAVSTFVINLWRH